MPSKMSAKILPFSRPPVEGSSTPPILYGGLYDIDPELIDEPNQAFQLLLWAQEDGIVLSQAVIAKEAPHAGPAPSAPHEDSAMHTAKSLMAAVRRIFEQTGRQPAAIVVNSQILATTVREVSDEFALSVGETPPTDDLFAQLETEIDEGVFESSWIALLEDDSLIEEIFDVGGRFLDAEPWKHLPDEALLIGLFEEKDAFDGGPERIAYVMGRGGDEFGILLFDDLTDWRLYNHIARTAESGEELGGLPPWCSVSFDEPSRLSDFDREVMAREGWTTGRDREPILFTHGGGGESATTSQEDIAALHTLLVGASTMAEPYVGKNGANPIALPYQLDFEIEIEDDEEPDLDYRICVPPVALMGTVDRASDESGESTDGITRAFLESRLYVISPALWKRDKATIDELTRRMNELGSQDPRLEGFRPTAVFGAELFLRLTLEHTLAAKPSAFASQAHYQDTFRVSGLFLEFLSDNDWLDPRACRAVQLALRDTRRRHKAQK